MSSIQNLAQQLPATFFNELALSFQDHTAAMKIVRDFTARPPLAKIKHWEAG